MIEKPMLAHSWDKYAHKVEYPCYVQYKLDGMRCLAVRDGDEIKYFSRALKEIKTVHHLDSDLLELMDDGDVWDGELYTEGVGFQTLISWIKREQEDTVKVQYHVYDKYSSIQPFEARYQCLEGYGNVRAVPTYRCFTEEQIDIRHKDFTKRGYEGTMIRNRSSKYKHGKRSFDLLKRKDWFDEEYTITEVVEGKGKFKECAVFICLGPNKTFAVTSPGTVEQKKKYWSQRYRYVGKQVTVKYQEKTDAGIPRFPVAIGVRDYE